MALVRCDFFSDVLGLSTSMTVILPQSTTGQIGMAGSESTGPAPVLYLLHGLSDDDTIWLRRTSIERYVAPLGLAVVMPQVHRSFYTDEAHGNRYWTFLSEELPALVDELLPAVPAPRGHLRRRTVDGRVRRAEVGAAPSRNGSPPRPACPAPSMSAGCGQGEWRPDLMDQVFGADPIAGGGNDLFSLVDEAAPAAAPPLWLCCGTEDHGCSTPTGGWSTRCAARAGRRRTVRAGRPRVGVLGRADPGRARLAPAVTEVTAFTLRAARTRG